MKPVAASLVVVDTTNTVPARSRIINQTPPPPPPCSVEGRHDEDGGDGTATVQRNKFPLSFGFRFFTGQYASIEIHYSRSDMMK